MDKLELVSIKVTKDARRMLKILSAHHDANLYEVVEALSRADMNKHRLKLPKKDNNDG